MPDVLHDIALLLRLRLRHGRTEIIRWLLVTGSDFEKDAKLSDRIYQVYAVVLIFGAFVLMWLAFLNSAAKVGVALGATTCAQLAALLWIIPVMTCVALSAHWLVSCPVKLVHPDILWLTSALLPSTWMGEGLIVNGFVAAVAGVLLGFAVGTMLQSVVTPIATATLLAVSLLGVVALAWIVGLMRYRVAGRFFRTDMTLLVQANALYAELQPLRSRALQAPGAYERLRRRKLMAARRPLLALPDLKGRRFFLARAVLSHVRQHEGIADLVVWGASIVPLGALLTAAPGDIGILLMWLMATVSLIPRARELTRVFADDGRVRLVSDAIACPRFELLLLDSLPATAFVVLLALVVTGVLGCIHPVSIHWGAAICTVLSMSATLLFAGGLDPAGATSVCGGPRFELAVAGYAVLVPTLALASSVLSAIVGCAYVLTLGVRCRKWLSRS